jgi:hypothetical protein
LIAPPRTITVFGVGSHQGEVKDLLPDSSRTVSINIIIIIKTPPGCGGNMRQRTCTPKQISVEFDVQLTNHTKEPLRGAGYGYQLAERTHASPFVNTYVTGPSDGIIWRPHHDNIVALNISCSSFDVSIWSHFLSQNEPMLVNLRVDARILFYHFVDCIADKLWLRMSYYYSNTCSTSSRRKH